MSVTFPEHIVYYYDMKRTVYTSYTLYERNVHILRKMENKWQKPNVPSYLVVAKYYLCIYWIYLVCDVNLPSVAGSTSSSCWVVGVVGGQQSIYNNIIIYARGPGIPLWHEPVIFTIIIIIVIQFFRSLRRVPARRGAAHRL